MPVDADKNPKLRPRTTSLARLGGTSSRAGGGFTVGLLEKRERARLEEEGFSAQITGSPFVELERLCTGPLAPSQKVCLSLMRKGVF